MKNKSFNDIFFFLTYFIDGKTFVWIYIFINKIFEMKNISFFLTYFLEGKTVRSVVYGWLQSHI